MYIHIAVILLRRAVTITPDTLSTQSEGTLVAVMHTLPCTGQK